MEMLPMRDGQTNDKRRTREDRATQPMDAGWLSFAMRLMKGCTKRFQKRCILLTLDLQNTDKIVVTQQLLFPIN